MTKPSHISAKKSPMHVSRISWLISILMLAALVLVIVMNLGEAEAFVKLARKAQPWWLELGVLLQIATYICAGAVWRIVARSAGHKMHITTLARLSVEQLSMDQLVPSGGMAGTLLVIRAMRRRSIPASIAMEALLVDVLSHYTSFAIVSIVAIVALAVSGHATPLLYGVVAVISIALILVPIGIWWALEHRTWTPPAFLARRESIKHLMDAIKQVSTERVLSPVVLGKTFLMRMLISLLDAATLWVMLQAIGTTVSPLTAFIALAVASIAGAVSFLPGGIGTFEAACTATLALLGTPVEAALTGTLLFRGLTLWLPLIPGWFLARSEMSHRQ